MIGVRSLREFASFDVRHVGPGWTRLDPAISKGLRSMSCTAIRILYGDGYVALQTRCSLQTFLVYVGRAGMQRCVNRKP